MKVKHSFVCKRDNSKRPNVYVTINVFIAEFEIQLMKNTHTAKIVPALSLERHSLSGRCPERGSTVAFLSLFLGRMMKNDFRRLWTRFILKTTWQVK